MTAARADGNVGQVRPRSRATGRPRPGVPTARSQAAPDRTGAAAGTDRRPADRRAADTREAEDMGALDGRIAIITGAGRGIGREYALLFAAEGAKVVVNDLGGALDGSGDDRSAAQQVVDEITAAGGEAVANADDVTDWDGGKRLVDTAIETFGDLHVLVNNAGILRDRVLVNMSEAGVGRGHPRPPEGPLRAHPPRRRLLARADQGRRRGQGVGHQHLVDLGPARQPGPDQLRRGQGRHRRLHHHRRHRAVPLRGAGQRARPQRPHPDDRGDPGPGRHRAGPRATPPTFDAWDPANIAPLVAYLATEGCPATGKVYFILGGQIRLFQPWTLTDTLEKDDRWTVAELQAEMHKLGG